ncbi:MAG: DEAD/DEAH box helicase [Actinoplanes sp.]
MSRVTLRPYQEQALAAEDAYRAEHPTENRLLVEMATGLGKSITLCERARRYLDSFEGAGNRVLIIVHTDELVRQLAADAAFVCGEDGFTVGIVKATQNEVDADIVVASVQTLIQPGRMDYITSVGYLIIDEAHHAVADSYVKIMRHVGGLPDCKHEGREGLWCWDCRSTGWTMPPIPVLGMTATPSRSDGQGLGHVWHNLVFSRSLIWGIRHGYLIDIIPYSVHVPVAMASAADMDGQMADSLAPEVVVDAWREKVGTPALETASPRGGWGLEPAWHLPSTILFAPLVKSANAFADAFSAQGIKAEVVSDKMPKAEIRAVLERFKAGVTTVLCNAMMLTEGVNIPRISCVIWARPVRKEGSPLLIQGVGRGTRFWISPDAPPRDEQRLTLLVVTPETSAIPLAGVADLSEHAAEGRDGVSILAMEDAWDLGKDLPDESVAYTGPVVVERWDAAVQASSKAWKYTSAGVPFLPTAKRGEGYVFLVEAGEDAWKVWLRRPATRGEGRGAFRTVTVMSAPDLELAMAAAEDIVHEKGGSVGALLADKSRPWRDKVPTQDMIDMARRIGIQESEIRKVLNSKSAGKAGRLSDMIDQKVASAVLDGVVKKIKEKSSV